MMVYMQTLNNINCQLNNFFTGVEVRFQQLSYTVTEGQSVRVCMNIIGFADIEVTVEVNTSPVDAECKIKVLQCL